MRNQKGNLHFGGRGGKNKNRPLLTTLQRTIHPNMPLTLAKNVTTDTAQAPRLSTCCDQGTHTVECQLHTPKKKAATRQSAARIIRHAPLNPEHAVTDAATRSATNSDSDFPFLKSTSADNLATHNPSKHASHTGQERDNRHCAGTKVEYVLRSRHAHRRMPAAYSQKESCNSSVCCEDHQTRSTQSRACCH